MAIFSILMILLITAGTVGFPASRAFVRSIEIARMEESRATPQEPWYFFFHSVRRMLKWWAVAWAVMLAGVIVLSTISISSSSTDSLPMRILLVANVVMLPASVGIWCVALAFFLSPRISNLVLMTLASTFAAVVLVVVCVLLLRFLPEGAWSVTKNSPGMSSKTMFIGPYTFVPACLGAGCIYWRARRKGAAWFRFKN